MLTERAPLSGTAAATATAAAFFWRGWQQHILGSLLLSTGNGGCMQQSLANAVHGDAAARHILVV